MCCMGGQNGGRNGQCMSRGSTVTSQMCLCLQYCLHTRQRPLQLPHPLSLLTCLPKGSALFAGLEISNGTCSQLQACQQDDMLPVGTAVTSSKVWRSAAGMCNLHTRGCSGTHRDSMMPVGHDQPSAAADCSETMYGGWSLQGSNRLGRLFGQAGCHPLAQRLAPRLL